MAFLMTTLISLVVSLIVVKLTAPCVVKEAMVKEYISKQMEMKMIKHMMHTEMFAKKMEMEMRKTHHDKKGA